MKNKGPGRKPKEERNRKIIQMIRSGSSYSDVSKKFNLARTTIWEIYHRFKDRYDEEQKMC